ncbi:MAG: GNAT family N-acetyltransferase [Chloroflexota bacterium]
MNDEERRRVADANVVAAFSLARKHHAQMPGGVRRFGSVDAIATGSASGFFNPVLALRPESTLADVATAVSWIEELGLLASVQVGADLDARVRPGLEVLGFAPDPWQMPIMVLELGGSRPPDPGRVEIRTGQAELFDDWHAALATSDAVRPVLGPGLLGDPDVRVSVGYLDGAPVSCAAAIRSDSCVGIYAVGTLEHARRRGIGRAVTWAAIEAGASAWGSSIAILQSSEMGVPVYRSMGFQEITRYVEYARPAR